MLDEDDEELEEEPQAAEELAELEEEPAELVGGSRGMKAATGAALTTRGRLELSRPEPEPPLTGGNPC